MGVSSCGHPLLQNRMITDGLEMRVVVFIPHTSKCIRDHFGGGEAHAPCAYDASIFHRTLAAQQHNVPMSQFAAFVQALVPSAINFIWCFFYGTHLSSGIWCLGSVPNLNTVRAPCTHCAGTSQFCPDVGLWLEQLHYCSRMGQVLVSSSHVTIPLYGILVSSSGR
jgi:hypothetical protein